MTHPLYDVLVPARLLVAETRRFLKEQKHSSDPVHVIVADMLERLHDTTKAEVSLNMTALRVRSSDIQNVRRQLRRVITQLQEAILHQISR